MTDTVKIAVCDDEKNIRSYLVTLIKKQEKERNRRKSWQIIEKQNGLTVCVCLLAAVRIILCLFPQNRWTDAEAPLSWGIYRNIPFVLLGLLIIFLFAKKAAETNDKGFRFMWLAIVLSFAFYITVVLFAGTVPVLGMLMIPKTCAYVWIVLMGYYDMKKHLYTHS